MLYKAYGKSMARAFLYMCSGITVNSGRHKPNLSSRQFEILKKEASNYMSSLHKGIPSGQNMKGENNPNPVTPCEKSGSSEKCKSCPAKKE